MSTRGILSNKLYVEIEIPFDKAWDDLGLEEQKQVILDNISIIETDDLISEIESRGFTITTEE